MRTHRSSRRIASSALAVLVSLSVVASAGAGVPENTIYEEAYFPSGDGTVLHADVLRPRGVERAPVVMTITPYNAHGSSAQGGGPPIHHAPVAQLRPWEHGYAVVNVDLRGFGASGGCWDAGGPGEQADVKTAVEWAAAQPWSDGGVVVAGGSYDGWTGIMALANQPRGLRAVIPLASNVNGYEGWYTNGVPTWTWPGMETVYPALTLAPGSAGSSAEYHGRWAAGLSGDACGASTAAAAADPDRTSSFWRARRLAERAADSAVPVFTYHGFLDYNVSPDAMAKLAPRLGGLRTAWWAQAGHEPPPPAAFLEQMQRFLDRTMKGAGAGDDDPRAVVQEAPSLRWRTEPAWPPPDAENVPIRLLAGSYTDASGNASGDDYWNPVVPATLPFSSEPSGRGTWTFTPPLPHQAHLAGLPRLRVQVDGPASARLVALLYDVSRDGTALLITRGATLVGDGRIDIDLFPQDWRVAAGHRLGLLISGSDDSYWMPGPGTGRQVRVRTGTIDLPALRRVRNQFVPGDAGERFGVVKQPITVDPATVADRTSDSPPPLQQEGGG